MNKITMRTKRDAAAMVEAAWQTVGESFEHLISMAQTWFCRVIGGPEN